MSYHEKSAWACLISIVVVFAPYFLVVFGHPTAYVGLFVAAVVGLITLLVGFHVVNAIVTASIHKTGHTPKADELDQIIELRAARLSGLVLGIIVLAWSVGVMLGAPVLGAVDTAHKNFAGEPVDASDFAIPVSNAVFWVQVLFAGFVAANVTYYGKIVASYRRMANG